jgi:shikimate 5-dehydrogenase
MNEEANDIPHEFIVESVTDILDVLARDESSLVALQILATVTSYIFCNGFCSYNDTLGAKDQFMHIVDETMDRAESLGATSWTRGVKH